MRILVVLFFCTLLVSSCETYEEVIFKNVSGIRMIENNGENLIIGVKASLSNPNAYDIKIKKSKFNLSVNGKHIGKTILNSKVTLKKKSTEEHEFRFSVNKKELMASAFKDLGLLIGKKTTLKIEGKLKAGAWGISKKFPVSHEQPIDARDLKLF